MSFGFNSALSFVTEMLQRSRAAARSTHQIAVVEVTGKQTGWLALQSAIAVCADAVLIPEIRYDLDAVAAKLSVRAGPGTPQGWWWGLKAPGRWPARKRLWRRRLQS